MADLTDKTDLTSGTTTEGDFQDGIGALYDYVAQLCVGSSRSNPSIASGVISPTAGVVLVDTESDSASDNLDSISTTSLGAKVIFMRCESAARPVTIRHMQGGSGQIYLNGAANATLDNITKMICLIYNATTSRWEELWRSWGVYVPETADKSATRTAIGIGTAGALDFGTSADQVPKNSSLGALAYIGVLNSVSYLADLLITNGKIANATLTYAKWADAAAGSLLTWNASNHAALFAIGTEGQVLTVESGVIAWKTPADNSAVVLIEEIDLDGLSTVDCEWEAGIYKKIVIDFDSIGVTTGTNVFGLRLFIDESIQSGAVYNATGKTSQTSWQPQFLNGLASASLTTQGQLEIRPLAPVNSPMMRGWGFRGASNNASLDVEERGWVAISTGDAITGFRLLRVSGTGVFKAGTKMRVWGYK